MIQKITKVLVYYYTARGGGGVTQRQSVDGPSSTVIIAAALSASLFVLAAVFTVGICFIVIRNRKRALQVTYISLFMYIVDVLY